MGKSHCQVPPIQFQERLGKYKSNSKEEGYIAEVLKMKVSKLRIVKEEKILCRSKKKGRGIFFGILLITRGESSFF